MLCSSSTEYRSSRCLCLLRSALPFASHSVHPCRSCDSMTDTGLNSIGLSSSHSAYLRPNIARVWGCAARSRSRPGLGGTGTLPPPIQQMCRVSARSGLPESQAASLRQLQVSASSTKSTKNCLLCSTSRVPEQSQELQTIEIQQQSPYQQRHQLGSGPLRTVAIIAAVASCLHAAPALADTAVQGAEEIAKSLASSDSVMGRLQNSASRKHQCTIVSVTHATWLQVHLALSRFAKDLCQDFCSYCFQNWVIRLSL